MDDFKVLEQLTKRVIKYLKIDLSMEKIDENFLISDVDTLEYKNITTFITLSGDITGTVGFSVSRKLATIMSEHFIFGELSKKLVEELTIQIVAEILNITLGNIIKELNIVKNGGKVEISTPYTMYNKESITKKEDGKWYISNIPYGDENITLSYIS